MDRVSRPLVGLLVATVAFFALWLTALRPSSSGHGGSGGALGQYQPAIDAAHAAVGLSSKIATAQSGADAASTSTTATTRASAQPAPETPAASKPATGAAPAAPSTPAAAPSSSQASAKPSGPAAAVAAPRLATAAQRLRAVLSALGAHKALALLFFNPAAADDRAVARELHAIPGHGGRVFRLAVPISELSSYSAITNQVAVTTSPTLLVIDRRRTATTIVGYASAFEIGQRVADALAVAP